MIFYKDQISVFLSFVQIKFQEMKSISKTSFMLCGALLMGMLSFAQSKNYSIIKSKKMDAVQNKNKEVIRNLYENVLNNRKLELLSSLIAEEYTSSRGIQKVDGFKQQIVELLQGFPDAQWQVDELLAEGNKVMVRQQLNGTHAGQFQNITATGKRISTKGIAIYELKDGMIINQQIQTDRFGFLQQLGVLPTDLGLLSNKNVDKEQVYFVDKFFVPKNSIEEFTQRMNYNRNFIKNLDGYIRDEVYEQKDEEGNISIITIAAWENKVYLDKAKEAIQAEYKRIGFDPAGFYQRLDIKFEYRGLYSKPDNNVPTTGKKGINGSR
jgi:predicted ester cyclase